MNNSKTFKINSVNELETVVDFVINQFSNISLICLEGDLGSGKTTFAKLFIYKKLGIKKVTSPTFSLLNIYENNHDKIFHYDLYRLKSPDELNEISLNENISKGYNIIEWPQIAYESISGIDKLIITFNVKKNIRDIKIKLIN